MSLRHRARPRAAVSSIAAVLFFLIAIATARADTITVEGPRTLVRSTIARQKTAERARDVLEKAIAIYEQNLPYRLPAGKKLVLNLFATKAEYADAVKKIGADAFIANEAVTANRDYESYLVCQPRADAPYLELVGDLPDMTIQLACHEGVHQFVRRAGAPGCVLWPDWYAEGMAEHVSELCLRALSKDPTFPYVEDKKNRVIECLANGTWTRARDLVASDLASTKRRDVLYSQFYSFYRFLAEDGPKLRKMNSAVRAIAGAKDAARMSAGCARALEDAFGKLEALDAAWRDRVSKEHPAWFERIRGSQTIGDEVVCANFPEEGNAILISTTPRAQQTLELTCEVWLANVGERDAEIYFGFQRPDAAHERFLKVSLLERRIAMRAWWDNAWHDEVLQSQDLAAPTFTPAKWVAVRLVVADGKARIDVDGKTVFDRPIPAGFNVGEGCWGVGVYKSIARFKKIAAR